MRTVPTTDEAAAADLAPSRLPPIVLPNRGHGERARRRQRRYRRQGLVALAVLIVLAVAAVTAIPDRSRPAAPAAGAPTAARGAGDALLVAQVGPAGEAVALSVLVGPVKGSQGTVLLIPPGTMTEVASLGLEPVARGLDGGPPRLLAATANLLGVRLTSVVTLSAADWAGVVGKTGPLPVEVPERVEDVDATGRVRVLYEAGSSIIEPDEVADFLAVRGRGTDLARLARHQVFWNAWLRALRGRPEARPAGELGRIAAAVGEAGWRVRVLPVRALGGASSGMYQVDEPEATQLISRVFPTGNQLGAGRPRVRVLNGSGAIAVAQRVADQLLPVGVRVTLTGNADRFDHDKTQVVYYEAADRPVAERVRKALGVGMLVRNRNATEVVDVTVIVGKDYATQ